MAKGSKTPRRTRKKANAVTVRLPDRPIEHKDVVFTVRLKGKQFGRLKVSKGSVVWLPGKKSKGYRLTWAQTDRVAKEAGRHGVFPV
jgi:hypothetical protein